MTSILFWNINKKPLLKEIVALCHTHEIDVLVLAECELSDVTILQAINPNLKRKYLAPFNPSSYLSFFYRYSPECIGLVKDDGRTSMRRISPPIGNDFILVALHLPCKLRMNDEEQEFDCVSVIQSF